MKIFSFILICEISLSRQDSIRPISIGVDYLLQFETSFIIVFGAETSLIWSKSS